MLDAIDVRTAEAKKIGSHWIEEKKKKDQIKRVGKNEEMGQRSAGRRKGFD